MQLTKSEIEKDTQELDKQIQQGELDKKQLLQQIDSQKIKHDITESEDSEENEGRSKVKLDQLNHKRLMQVLKKDAIMNIALKTDIGDIITRMEISGVDLANINEMKIKKWWGLEDTSKSSLIISFVQTNSPFVQQSLLDLTDQEKQAEMDKQNEL